MNDVTDVRGHHKSYDRFSRHDSFPSSSNTMAIAGKHVGLNVDDDDDDDDDGGGGGGGDGDSYW